MSSADAPNVALIHSVLAAIPATTRAFASGFPEARLWHLLDDQLARDADLAGGLTPPLRRRMLHLVEHAFQGKADVVVIGCSMYQPLSRIAADLWGRPVVGADDAMYERIVERAPLRLALLASLRTALLDTEARLTAALGRSGATELVGVLCVGAAEATSTGDEQTLLMALLDGARTVARDVEAFALCQYSLVAAAEQLARELGAPVYSPAHLAAQALRKRLVA